MTELIDQIVEKAQMWCEQYGKRLSNVMTDENGYFLELNDDVKDFQKYLPQEFQELNLSKLVN
jgi:hypothetical protein